MAPDKIADRLDLLREELIEARVTMTSDQTLRFLAWFFRRYKGRMVSVPPLREVVREYALIVNDMTIGFWPTEGV